MRRLLALLLVVALLGPTPAAAVIACSIPNAFAAQSGPVPSAQLDANFSALSNALCGQAASTTDLAAVGGVRQTWRNLVLRTHPDQDKAGTKVALLRLDEVTLDSGKRYAGLALPLTADLTVTGPGGLDTGSRTASRWYEIHLIGKSDGIPANLALLFHLATQYTLDQSQLTRNGGQKLNDTTSEQIVCQKFTPGTSGLVEFFDLWLQGNGAIPAAGVWVELRADNAGLPAATALATSDKFDASKLGTAGLIQGRFVFRSPISLTAATQYWGCANQNYTTSASNYVSLGYSTSGTNQMYTWNGSAWAAVANATLAFREVVTVTSPLVPPTGYSDQAQIGWVYNGSGNAFDAISFQDRRARRLAGGFATGSTAVTAGIPLLTDLTAAIPPGRITLTSLAAGVDTGSIYFMLAGVPDGYGLQDGASPFGGALRALSQGTDAGNPTVPLIGVVQTEYQAIYQGINISHAAQTWINGWEW